MNARECNPMEGTRSTSIMRKKRKLKKRETVGTVIMRLEQRRGSVIAMRMTVGVRMLLKIQLTFQMRMNTRTG